MSPIRAELPLKPLSSFQEPLLLDVPTAEIFVRVSTTSGASAQSARMNQILINTARGWRVFSILPGDVTPN